jgi:hypothetical protein
LRCRRPAKAHHNLGANRAGGSCRPAKGRDGAATGAEPPFISSSPAMELRVVGGPTRGHRSLVAYRAGERVGTAAGHRPPWITDSGGAGEAGGQRRNPTVAVLWSAVTMEHDLCGAAVEGLLENGAAE